LRTQEMRSALPGVINTDTGRRGNMNHYINATKREVNKATHTLHSTDLPQLARVPERLKGSVWLEQLHSRGQPGEGLSKDPLSHASHRGTLGPSRARHSLR
jgi:hypothetical protein